MNAPVAQLPLLRQPPLSSERVLPERVRRERGHRARRETVCCSDGRGSTLEQKLGRAWEDLRAVGVADCPVCGAKMDAGQGGATCHSCGSVLS